MNRRRWWGRGELLALAALGFLLLVTSLWWAMALWPPGAAGPHWLEAAREVCFGAYDDGLPDTAGWILLAGEPLGMVVALYVIWREPLVSGIRALASSGRGRGVLGGWILLVIAGLGAAAWRVSSATAEPRTSAVAVSHVPMHRLDTPAPELRLIDQHGETLTLDRFAGRHVLVTFAYAHCETVCPLLVHDVLEVQRRLASSAPVLVLVTLDPWRDVPARLPQIAARWGLGTDAFVVSGGVPEVEEVLARWGVATSRDLRTGEIVHAAVTFILDERGTLVYATTGPADRIVALLGALDPASVRLDPASVRVGDRSGRPASASSASLHHEESDRPFLAVSEPVIQERELARHVRDELEDHPAAFGSDGSLIFSSR